MQLGKRPRRVIAATLLTILLTNTIAPTVAYALTSGPTAPEATSFEPVDTTDMVNLQTGDLTYNIPLLEVPGPEGGYPLSLSYHAGIQPNEDASWVGLGWSLNPGAITRSVNSYPDDWHDVSQVVRDYWSGGETKTFGFNLGLAMGPANASLGLSFSNDTYKGFGAGFDVSVGFGLSQDLGLNLGMGVSPYGEDLTVSAGLSIGKNSPVSGSLGISTDFKSTEFSGGLNIKGIGISMSTSGSVSLSAGGAGISKAFGPNAGRIQSESKGFFLPILGISSPFSWNYTRYWSDETATIKTHGALYMYPAEQVWEGYWASGFPYHSYDVYHLPDDPDENNIVEEPDVRKVPGGSFPDNDVYQVVSQGLSGSFKPYAYQEKLYTQSVYGNGSDLNARAMNNDFFTAGNAGRSVTANYPAGSASSPQSQIHFRFSNDFSNYYRQDKPDFSLYLNSYQYNFDDTYSTGNKYGIPGYNQTSNKLAGSRNIEYFTNRQINATQDAKNNGFINIDAQAGKGFTRAIDDMIGGFSITNESGVTYHYALPAYAYGEVVYTENMPSERAANGYIWNKVSKPGKYAYTWFLTSITGPDFVDKDNNGYAGDGDWGYWVNFEYGKWTDSYGWRNPSDGFHRDLDTKFQNYSKGKKELYYLNAIKTRTHAAIFEKEVRFDGKSTSNASTDINNHNGASSFIFDNTVKASLQLSRIFLLPKNELAAAGLNANYDNLPYYYFNGNVYDKVDVDPVRTSLTNGSIKIVNLNYDYSLCPGTINSYDYNNVNTKLGKLTLTGLQFLGKKGAMLIPSTLFSYDLPASEVRAANITFSNYDNNKNTSDIQVSSADVFQTGDVLKFTAGGNADYCTVIQKSSSVNYEVIFIRNNVRSYNGATVSASTTKNPFYAADYQDSWAMFKSDFDPKLKEVNENLSRLTSAVSAKSVDVWSLRSIRNPLGSTLQVNYESDTYRKSVLNDYISLILQQQGTANMSTMEITFNVVNEQNVPLADYLAPGQDITSYLIAHEFYKNSTLVSAPWVPFQFTGSGLSPLHTHYKYTVVSIVGNTLKVHLEQQPYSGSYSPIYDIMAIANLRLNDTKNFEFQGGGLRVSSLALNSAADEISKKTVYDYKALSPSLTSGVTAFQPQVFDTYDAGAYRNGNFDQDAGINEEMKGVYDKVFRKALYQHIDYLLAISRELPPPSVIYEYVGVRNEVMHPGGAYRQVEGITVYQHECFSSNMVGVIENSDRLYVPGSYPTTVDRYNRNMSLKVYTARLGLLKRIIQYDDKGIKQSEQINSYLHDDIVGNDFRSFADDYDAKLDQYDHQGQVEERFANGRTVWIKNDNNAYVQSNINVLSAREEYPVIQTGQKTINYVDGSTSIRENKEFDFYSGAVTKTIETDPYGNRFMTEVVPAYRNYGPMGLKLTAIGNKNMLTQVAAQYLYKVDASNNNLGLVAAGVSTWGNNTQVTDENGNLLVQNVANNTQGNVWRLQQTYNWMPDNKTANGLTANANFVNFNWSNPAASDQRWKKTSEVTLYDVYSKSLEAKDINNNYAAARMGYGNKKVILTGTNTKYFEMAYSGAEDESIDQANNVFVKKADGVASTAAGTVHTGARSLKIPLGGKKGFVYTVSTNNLTAGRDYIAYVWVTKTSGTFPVFLRLFYDINGVVKSTATISASRIAGNWALISLPIAGADITPGNTLTVGCRNDDLGRDAYVDDMRFQPMSATTTAFVFDAFSGELTHTLNNNNFYTRFEYDGAGRVVKTFSEKFNVGEFKTNEYFYNYGQTPVGLYANVEKNQSFTRTNCAPGYLGTLVNYKVEAGKYLSGVSQTDADQQAQADINANGQKYANIAGECVTAFYNAEIFGLFTKTTCGPGEMTRAIQYLVSYGKYSSTISQADADAQAQADLVANGQEYAELNGYCYPEGTLFGHLVLENVSINPVTGEELADVVVYFYSDPNLLTPAQIFETTAYVKETVINQNTQTIISEQYISPDNYISGHRCVLWTQKRLKGVENGIPIQRTIQLLSGLFWTYEAIE